MDALRLLAVLGAILWMIPMIWPVGESAEASQVPMSRALFYIFGVWLFLIAAAALLARFMKKASADETEEAARREGGR